MKELSIEEKANRYDKAIEIAKSKIKNDKDHVLYEDDVIEIFPELKVSDDERIRKSLIELFHDTVSNDEIFCDYGLDKTEVLDWLEKQYKKDSQVTLPSFTFDDILALQCCMETVKKVQEDKDLYEKLKDLHGRVYDAYQLEKQGKQKPINKVEPKFKEGDWVFIEWDKWYKKGLFQIKNVDCFGYSFDEYFTIPFIYENVLSKWTIEDAKDGDVLVASDGSIFIYKYQKDKRDNGAVHYIAVTPYNDLVINENDYSWDNKNVCHPATKDEQTILFERIKEAGYEWDAMKKQLKKL